MNTLFIRLEGPFQAWGLRARWSVRDTALEPTKSGVVGVLACALGWGAEADARIRALSRAFAFGVRVDRAGRLLRDYHTVSGGVRSADRKIKITASTKEPETVVSERYYLCDASFLAALQLRAEAGLPLLDVSSGEALVNRCADALQRPVWPPFLGRRACVPATPLFAGIGSHESLEEALLLHPFPEDDEERAATGPRGRQRVPPPPVHLILERAPHERRGSRRLDEVESFVNRTFGPRYAEDTWVTVPASGPAADDAGPGKRPVDFWEDTL